MKKRLFFKLKMTFKNIRTLPFILFKLQHFLLLVQPQLFVSFHKSVFTLQIVFLSYMVYIMFFLFFTLSSLVFNQCFCMTFHHFIPADNPHVQYSAVTSFVFLRFFAVAILSPHTFHLRPHYPVSVCSSQSFIPDFFIFSKMKKK